MFSQIELEIADAWRSAAEALGFRIDRASVGTPWVVWIRDFGASGGTACRHAAATHEAQRALHEWGEQTDAFVSLLGDSYRTYDRELFVATLDDWGWTGRSQPPAWYTGASW